MPVMGLWTNRVLGKSVRGAQGQPPTEGFDRDWTWEPSVRMQLDVRSLRKQVRTLRGGKIVDLPTLGRPGDERPFFHKKLLGLAGKFLPGPIGTGARLLSGVIGRGVGPEPRFPAH